MIVSVEISVARPALIFQNLDVDDGLPDPTVRAILQDHQGFMWLATQGGLVRYDGHEMRLFRPVEGDSTSIGGRLTATLLEDSHGMLWVGTILNGLFRYDPSTESFTDVTGHDGEPDRIPPTWVWDMDLDSEGMIWVVTRGHGLHRLDPVTGLATSVIPGPHWPEAEVPAQITSVLVDSSNQVWITTRSGHVHVMDLDGNRLHILEQPTAQVDGGPMIRAEELYETRDGRIWFSGHGGIVSWDPRTRQQRGFLPDPFNSTSGWNFVVKIVEDTNGILWLGCEAGMLRFDPRFEAFTRIQHDPDNPNSPIQGAFLSSTIDASGLIWAGTWQGGLTRFDPAGSLFRVHRHDPDIPGSLHADQARTVIRDRKGVLWVGTGEATAGSVVGGLNRMNSDGKTFEHFPLPRPYLHVVESIAERDSSSLWLGTNKGLWVFDRQSDEIRQHRPGDPELVPLTGTPVTRIFVDDAGRAWVGTRDAGLFRLAPDGSLDRHFPPAPDDPRGFGARAITSMLQDSRDRLWIGTPSAGLHLYHPESDDFTRYYKAPGDIYSVSQILEREDGKLWYSSLGGLVLFDPREGEIVRTITTEDGLPNDRSRTLLRDNRGRLWIATSRGLAVFDPADDSIRAFDTLDGLPTNDIQFKGIIDEDGTAWIPSQSGLITFRPDQFVASTYEPNVVLTGLQIFDEPVVPGPESPLPVSITTARELDLAHDQNVLRLSFAALDFSRPDLAGFRFRLQGHDPDWRTPEYNPSVNYTNLGPGRYVFEVEGTNRDGVWSPHTASIDIRVRHPWWASPMSNTIYLVAALALLALVFRTLLRRARHAELLRLQLAQVTKLEELDRVKSRFFANISHEFRTPLTLIEGLLHRHRDEPETLDRDTHDMIFRNTRRLRELVDQLLDLARLEAGRFNLKWQSDDLASFVRAIGSPFSYVAEARNIDFETVLPEEEVRGWFDREVIETVIANLLSNAMKFSPEGERVTLIMEVGRTRNLVAEDRDRMGLSGDVRCRDLVLTVSNTGTYIPPEDRERVFNRFIMAAAESMDGNVGSGVGLALVKELAQFMGGAVAVTSEKDGLTSFAVTLPLVSTPVAGAISAPVEESEFAGVRQARSRSRTLAETAEIPVPIDEDEEEASDLPLVLLVEDHPDLRAFLASELQGEYRILTAADGAEGLNAALEHVPDLVVSDVMMPNMDGFEMLGRLKSDPATDHVPVVMLTAKAEADSRKEGLKIGADDYLAKPLDPEELRIRVANLIGQRAKLREKYTSNIDLLPVKALPVASADEKFLAKALKIVDEHLEDEDFNVEVFAREIGLSRAQLHRKLKALTGMSATRVVRRQRLRRAAELLKAGYGSVSEVAFTVGFKSLSHFSSYFKDEFGVLPSEYGRE